MARKKKKRKGGTTGTEGTGGTGGNSSEEDQLAAQRAVRVGELKAAYAEVAAEVKNLNIQLQDQSLNLRESLDIEEDVIDRKQQQIKAQLTILDLATDDVELNKSLSELSITLTEEEEKRVGLAQEKLQGTAKFEARQKAINKVLSDREKTLRLTKRYYNQIDTSTQGVASNVELSYKYETSFLKALIKTGKGVDGVSSGFSRIMTNVKGLTSWQEVSYSFATRIWDATKDYAKELMEATKSLNKSTGLASEFAGSMEAVGHDFFVLGMSLSDVAGNIGTLTESFADFTLISKEGKEDLLKISAQMNALGISTEDYSSSLNFLTKSMGMTSEDAAAYTKDLAVYGAEIGKTPTTFIKEFAAAAPKLAIYGNRMEDVFKKLQKRSKATGIDFNTLLGVAEGFSTFDGITQSVAGLSAQFGSINLDPMELMMVDDPEERLRLIREAVMATGVQLDQLNSADRRLLMQNLKFEDAGQMMAYLSGEWDQNNAKNKDWNEMLTESSQIMDKLGAIAKSLAVKMGPVLKVINKWLDGATKTEETTRSTATIFYGLIPMFAGIAVSAVKWALSFGKVAKEASTVSARISTFTAYFNEGFTVISKIGDKMRLFVDGIRTAATTGNKLFRVISVTGKILSPIIKLFSKLLIPIGIILTLFETIPNMFKAWDKVDGFMGKFLLVLVTLGQFVFDFIVNPFIELFNFFGADIPKVNLFAVAGLAHDGVTGAAGGAMVMKSDEVMTNVPTGTSVLTKGNSQTIETLLGDLTTAINTLSQKGGKEKPVQVNLVVDGKTLATSVYNNSEYFAI